MRALIPVALSVSALAGRLDAQRLTPSPFTPAQPSPSVNSAPSTTAWLAVGGLLGGAAGLFGGALIGGTITEDQCEDCSIVGIVYGGIAGGSSLLPLGVHLANGRRGSYGKSLLASLAIGAAGFAISDATDEWGLMFAVPVAQLISSIAIERGTSRDRAETLD